MEFHQEKNGMVEKQYCKYSGLALDYVAISPDETAKWASVYDPSLAVEKDDKAPALVPDGIIMKPAASEAAPQEAAPAQTEGYANY
jgi:hypothetical protein